MAETRTGSTLRNYLLAFVVGLLIGFLPMWFMARTRGQERDAAQSALRVQQLQNRLGSATIDARRGDYEQARIAASDFFSNLRSELDRNDKSDLPPATHDNLKTLFDNRDEVVTLLARSDPASADRLSDLYVNYRRSVQP